MKKIFSLLLVVVLGVVLVACKRESTTPDLDAIEDHLAYVETVTDTTTGKADNYGRTETYYGTTANVTSMNHYSQTGANESDLYHLIVGTLYAGDFDWELAKEDGVLTAAQASAHDLSFTDEDSSLIHQLGYNRYPSQAASTPLSVTSNTTASTVEEAKLLVDDKWRITLRDDLTFEDGLRINAYVYWYSWKQVLDPVQNNARSTNLRTATNLPLVNGQEYYLQGKPVDADDESKGVHPEVSWEDVGFKVIDNLTFEITLTRELTQWQLMGHLTSAVLSAVHPVVYENSKDATGSTVSYGSIDYPIPSSGPYLIKNWQDGTAYTFNVNKNYKGYRQADYEIKAINLRVNSNETSILNEFESGNLDLAGVGSATNFPKYKDDNRTKITPTTSTFRFALGAGNRPEGTAWEYNTTSSAAMADVDFRAALYYALDRENLQADVRPNVQPSGTYLTSLYQATEEANEPYRSTEAAQQALVNAGLTEQAINNYGFDATEASRLFNKVYDKLQAENKLSNGKIVIEIVLFDAESNRALGGWAKAQFEDLFGKDKFEAIASYVTEDQIYDAWDNSDFDLTFSGWQGIQFNPASLMVQVYSSLYHPDTMLEGTRTDNLEITANLSNFKAHVAAKGNDATDEEKAIVATLDANGIWTGILDLDADDPDFETKKYTVASQLINLGSLQANYEGKKDDFASITAGIESTIIKAFIAVPIFENVGATVYSARVNFEIPEYHAWMGWGGWLYRSLD